MRKIEGEMIAAIKAGRNANLGNTAVQVWPHGAVVVKLHGHTIGQKIMDGGDGRWQFTLAGWNTPTTRSRVSALLGEFGGDRRGVYSKLGQAYVRRYAAQVRDPQGVDQPVESGEWF